MKRLLLPALASVSLLMAACSTTNQLAQQSNNNDDVYNSQAKAKEVDYAQRNEKSYRTDEQLYGGGDYRDDVDYDFDYGYAARLNRFQYASPWRTYYDNWYTYSYDPWYSYRYDPWFYGSGVSLSLGWGSPYYSNFYSPWGIYGYNYGYPYYGNYWGPVSYYGGYPGYGYGGYYGGGVIVNSRPQRSRPNLGTGNPNYGRDRNANRGYGDNGSLSRPVSSGRTSSTNTQRERPSIDRSSERPARAERPERAPYPSYTPSTQSSGSSYGGGSGSTSSGGGSSAPSRGSRGSR